jgi:hypothetical protein
MRVQPIAIFQEAAAADSHASLSLKSPTLPQKKDPQGAWTDRADLLELVHGCKLAHARDDDVVQGRLGGDALLHQPRVLQHLQDRVCLLVHWTACPAHHAQVQKDRAPVPLRRPRQRHASARPSQTDRQTWFRAKPGPVTHWVRQAPVPHVSAHARALRFKACQAGAPAGR